LICFPFGIHQPKEFGFKRVLLIFGGYNIKMASKSEQEIVMLACSYFKSHFITISKSSSLHEAICYFEVVKLFALSSSNKLGSPPLCSTRVNRASMWYPADNFLLF